MLKKISKMYDMASSAEGRVALRRARPLSIASHRLVRQLHGKDFSSIIDAGANVGQFARAAIQFFPTAHVWSIEPMPDVARKLRQNLRAFGQVEVIESAVGSSDGEQLFYKCEYNQLSSLLPMSGPDAEPIPVAESFKVRVARLDTLFEGVELTPPTLLKMDLQGYEMEALKGASELLKRVDTIVLETTFAGVYSGEALFPDILEFLMSKGFRFVRPLSISEKSSGEIFQMDALFKRVDGTST